MAELTPEYARRLFEAVRAMRAWQRKYYDRRTTPAAKEEALVRAKQCEREVDRLLDELDPPPSQATLFPAHDDPRPGAYSR